jgi:RHS repeat-associated protein
MGNLSEQVSASNTQSAGGSTMNLSLTNDTWNADPVDTVMGYGWTHSYNNFLFSQLGSMFRFDGVGGITKYKLGPGGSYTAAPGYFETLVKNPDGTFTLTQKDKTTFSYASIPNTPFLVAGPVWRLTKITDRNGNTTTLTYSAGNLTAITDTYGRSLKFTYTSQQKVATIVDPAGRVTAFQYDSTGHELLKLTDPNGNSIQYGYNSHYQLTGKTDKAGRKFSFIYSNNMPVTILDSAGATRATLSNPTNWATDPVQLAMNQLRVYVPSTTTNIDGRGNVWKYQYDANAYITQIMAPDGATTTYAYDPATLRVSSTTDANGHTTTYAYDAVGNMVKKTDALGNVTAYAYEPVFNMMTSMTDPRGRVTAYTIDPANGNRTGETDALGQARHWTYDSHGNVLTDTDKNGHTTTYHYDAFGDRVKTIDPLGNLTTMTYDAVGNRLSITDANNHTTSYQYDGMNRVIKETDAAGHAGQTFYDGEGNRTQAIDRNGHSTSYQYNLRQLLIKTTDALAHSETYAYDNNDNRVSMTDRNGHTATYQYDVQNRRTKTTDALGNTTTSGYDPFGNRTTQTDANGHTAAYTYDALNRRSNVTDAASEVTRIAYDTGTVAGCPLCGATPGSRLITAQTDANGKVTYFKYDAIDRQIHIVRKVGSTLDVINSTDAVTTYTYDAAGNLLSMTEPDGNTAVYQYDADNRKTKETNAAGDVTTASYDGANNLIGSTWPNLNTTTNVYDSLNRLVMVSDSLGRVEGYTYDAIGNRLSESDGNGNTTKYSYDAVNRLAATTDPLGKISTSQYDFVGNLLKAVDRDANSTTYGYDAINRRISIVDALGHTSQMQYDPAGNAVTFTDANSHSTQFAYDAVNRRTQETYADGKSRRFTYDGVGNILTRTDQIGQVTAYAYSDLYFLLGRSYPSGVNDSFTYDLSGRRLTAQRGTWPVTFTYDGANRITQTTQNGRTIGYVYNIPGRTRQTAYPGGRTIVEHADARGRLDHINDALPAAIVQYGYDLGNRVTTRVYRNGVSAAYSYNLDDWALTLQHSFGSIPIAGFKYSYDNEGNKQFENKLQDSAHSEAYQYDSIYRLIDYKVGTLVGSSVPVPGTQTAYSLDPVGNWNSATVGATTHTRQHDAVNELVKVDTVNLSYDANGNLKNDGVYSYAYDEENRLTGVTRISDGAVVGQYQYDALGRRVVKTAGASGPPVSTNYFYDFSRIVEEQTSASATLATYVFGNYIDEALTMDRGGKEYYFHQNGLWSVEAVTDATGTVMERYEYDAYGQPAVLTGPGTAVPPNAWGTPHSAIGNPWMFTGRQDDEETGIYYYRYRSYSPTLGRFITRDPIDYRGGVNLYAYTGDRPTHSTDSLGLADDDWLNFVMDELAKQEGIDPNWIRSQVPPNSGPPIPQIPNPPEPPIPPTTPPEPPPPGVGAAVIPAAAIVASGYLIYRTVSEHNQAQQLAGSSADSTVDTCCKGEWGGLQAGGIGIFEGGALANAMQNAMANCAARTCTGTCSNTAQSCLPRFIFDGTSSSVRGWFHTTVHIKYTCKCKCQ